MILYGYIFIDYDRHHEGYVELDSNDLKGLAHFICDDVEHDKMITDIWDMPVVTTFGNFLDKVDITKINFSELQKECIKLQCGMICEDEDVEDIKEEN